MADDCFDMENLKAKNRPHPSVRKRNQTISSTTQTGVPLALAAQGTEFVQPRPQIAKSEKKWVNGGWILVGRAVVKGCWFT